MAITKRKFLLLYGFISFDLGSGGGDCFVYHAAAEDEPLPGIEDEGLAGGYGPLGELEFDPYAAFA